MSESFDQKSFDQKGHGFSLGQESEASSENQIEPEIKARVENVPSADTTNSDAPVHDTEEITIDDRRWPHTKFGLGFEPYAIQFSKRGGLTHHFAGLDMFLFRAMPKSNSYVALGWSVASIRLQLGIDVLFCSRDYSGLMLKIGGRFEPISWLTQSTDKIGDARYTMGLLGEGGLGYQLVLKDSPTFQFVLQYIGGIRRMLSIGDNSNTISNATVLFNGCVISIIIL